MTPEEEVVALERKLLAREGKPGFEANIAAIKARLAELGEAPPEEPPGPDVLDLGTFN